MIPAQGDFEIEVMKLTQNQGVDVVLDGVGGKSFAKSYRCLKPMGRLIVFGVSGMVAGQKRNLWQIAEEWLTMPRFNPIKLIENSKSVMGFTLGSLKNQPEKRRQLLTEILALTAQGTFQPVVDRCFGFQAAGDAHLCLTKSRKLWQAVVKTLKQAG